MIAKGNALFLAPFADGFETSGNVPRSPVVYPTIGKGDEPDVFAETVGARESVQVASGPDLTSKSSNPTFLDYVRLKTDSQKIRATCFILDKPGGCAARSLPGRGQASRLR